MEPYLLKYKVRVREWVLRHARGKYALVWLSVVSFTESSFFLIPPDILLIPLILAGTQRWYYYASITTITSVLGGVFGYLIGAFFFELVGRELVELYHLGEELLIVETWFQSNAFLAVFLSAFTPIPYKIFTIGAGLFGVSFFVFLIASLLGRGLRYFLFSYLFHVFGERIGKIIFRYFNILSLLGALLLIAFLIIRFAA